MLSRAVVFPWPTRVQMPLPSVVSKSRSLTHSLTLNRLPLRGVSSSYTAADQRVGHTLSESDAHACARRPQVAQVAKSDLVRSRNPGAQVVGSLASTLGHDLAQHGARCDLNPKPEPNSVVPNPRTPIQDIPMHALQSFCAPKRV